MIPKWGMNPFCNVPIRTGAEQLRNRYPAAFTHAQIIDAFYNWKTIPFSVMATRSLEDALVEIMQAMSLLNMDQLLALGIAISPILSSAAQRTGVSGTMTRRVDTSVCNGVRLIYNHSLAYFEINFADVRRAPMGSTYLYYPRIVCIFYAEGLIFANDLAFLYGAGAVTGAILIDGASGSINDMNWAAANGPPLGSYMAGEWRAGERYDAITFTPKLAAPGATVTITGVTLENLDKVIFGEAEAVFTVSADQKTVTATVPHGAAHEPISFTTTDGDYYFTREHFRPQ